MRRYVLVDPIKCAIIASTVAFSLAAGAQTAAPQVIATGQSVTPTAVPGAVQQFLNPGLPAYPNFVAGEAVRSQLSPDGTTLAVLTAGQNSLDKPDGTLDVAASTQYVFLYDVTGANRRSPKLTQVIPQTNAHVGLVFSPDGGTLYAAGGRDDVVYAYTKSGGTWSLAGTIALGHGATGVGIGVAPNASGLAVSADGKTLVVANNYNDSISVVDTATRTVRYEHDLRPFFAGNEGTAGGIGGTYPFAVVVKGNETAYVSSDRDREVVAVDIRGATAGRLIKRIALDGNALGLTLDRSGSTLFVAEDNADRVAVINTHHNAVVAKIDTRGPEALLRSGRDHDRDGYDGRDHDGHDRDGHDRDGHDRDGRDDHGRDGYDHDGYDHDSRDDHGRDGRDHDDHDRDGRDRDDRDHDDRGGVRYTGAAPFAVTLSPDQRTLYVVNAGSNSIAVVPLRGDDAYRVGGLIPTGYDPHDIAFSADGSQMYIVNGKSVTGPNPGHLSSQTARITNVVYPGGNANAAVASNAANQYQFQLERASLVSAPVPARWDLDRLTKIVAKNNFYDAQRDDDSRVVRFLRNRIKHVIYIVKENRTFDQILGDLNNGSNGASGLTQFGDAITPNFHHLARSFVTLDNFTDPGDGSMDGWSWSLQGRVTNTETLTQQINYAFVNRGLSYESEGANRNVPVNFPTVAERDAAGGPAGTTNYSTATAGLPGGTINLLTGNGDHASSDAPFGVQGGYIFDAVLHAGGTVRNYGFLVNNIGSIGTVASPIADPFGNGVVQVAPLHASLVPFTDVYFRGYDQNYVDNWRYTEWKREFDQYVAQGNLPNLSLVRLSHDHMGAFATALGGVNTPEAQQADNDLAVGRLVQAVSESPFATSTLIIVTEDDSQDGPDHVDSHRAPAYLVGPYVRQGAVVSTHYSQVNVVRTIEDILGTQHLNLNTAFQRPIADVFDINADPAWSFQAEASTALQGTALAQAGRESGVRYARGHVTPKHDAKYWARVTQGFDFSDADRVPPAKFNRVLWDGMMPGKPYPGSVERRGDANVYDD